jgi:hypothetical protein
MPSTPVVGLIEEVVISGATTSATVLAKCDTGAKRTSIDEALAADLGLESDSKTVTVRSSNGVERRAVYPFEVDIGDRRHLVYASVTDRGAMSYDVIIGRDILTDYLVDSSTDNVS